MSAYTDADVQAAAKAIARRSLNGESRWSDYSRAALDVVAPAIAARAKAEALREVAEAMDSGWIDPDDLRYRTTDAPKGWLEACVADAWESMTIWAPYLRYRADEIERTP